MIRLLRRRRWRELNMIQADVAIHRVRRDITLGVLVKGLLIACVFGCLAFARPAVRSPALVGIVGIWIALSVTSARSSRLGSDSPLLIATGQFDEAERQIDQAMRAFSVFGPPKLRALHQLAVLRHAQRHWQEAAALSRALLGQRLGASRGLAKPSRLILAEALIELNDLPGGYAALSELYSQQLSLEEVLNLLALQLDYESRIGAWQKMFTGVESKVQLAELMPSSASARVQALLALAAGKAGRPDWQQWLRKRAELLGDVNSLAGERPILWELWTRPQEPLV
jgi:xanthosine utilization system XapX-like protein